MNHLFYLIWLKYKKYLIWFQLDLDERITKKICGSHISCPENVLWLAGVQHYNEIKSISICEFLPPHLAIYVDLPAEEVQKKLKQSGKVAR